MTVWERKCLVTVVGLDLMLVLSTGRPWSLNKSVIEASLSFTYILVNCRGYGQILIMFFVCLFVAFTNFHVNHNAPCLPPTFCTTIVFDFSWDDCNTQDKLETMVMQNFGGVNKVHYGRCESSVCSLCSVFTVTSRGSELWPFTPDSTHAHNWLARLSKMASLCSFFVWIFIAFIEWIMHS